MPSMGEVVSVMGGVISVMGGVIVPVMGGVIQCLLAQMYPTRPGPEDKQWYITSTEVMADNV